MLEAKSHMLCRHFRFSLWFPEPCPTTSQIPVLKACDLSSASTDTHTDVQKDGLAVAMMVELLSCCRQVGSPKSNLLTTVANNQILFTATVKQECECTEGKMKADPSLIMCCQTRLKTRLFSPCRLCLSPTFFGILMAVNRDVP